MSARMVYAFNSNPQGLDILVQYILYAEYADGQTFMIVHNFTDS